MSHDRAHRDLDRAQLLALVSVWLRRDMHLGGGRGAGLAGVFVMSSLFLLLGTLGACAMVFAGVPRFAFTTLGLLFGSMPSAMAVITDFGVTAIDLSDQDVVGHRPVSDRTYLAARMATVAFYALLVGIPAQLPYALGGLLAPDSTNLFPIAYLAVACGVIAATVSAVVLLYATISRTFGPKRLANLVLLVQLFSVSLFFIGGPMIGPTTALLARLDLSDVPYLRLLPFAWGAAAVDLLLGTTDVRTFALAALFGASLAALLVLLPRRLSLGYVDALSRQLAAASGERPPAPRRGRLAPLTLAGFSLARAALRDPQTRLRVVPTLVLPVIYAVLMVALGHAGDPLGRGGFLRTLSGLMPAGLLAVGPAGYLIATEFSSSWRAAWIFVATPVDRPGLIQRGVKLAALRTFLPGLLVYGAVIAIAWPLAHVAVVLLDVLCAAVMSVGVASFAVQAYPSSRPMQAGTSLRAQILTFGSLVVPIMAFLATWMVAGQSVVGHLVADALLLGVSALLHLGAEHLFDLAAGQGRPLLAVDPEGALAEERLRRSLWALGAAALVVFSLLLLLGAGYGLWVLSGRRGMEGLRASSALRAGALALEGGEARHAHALAVSVLAQLQGDTGALRLKGRAESALGLHAEALATFRRRAALAPRSDGNHLLMARSLRNLGRCEEAVSEAELETADERSADLAEALLEKGRALRACRRLSEAEEALRVCLSRAPSWGEAWQELAFVLEEDGRPGEAKRAHEASEELE